MPWFSPFFFTLPAVGHMPGFTDWMILFMLPSVSCFYIELGEGHNRNCSRLFQELLSMSNYSSIGFSDFPFPVLLQEALMILSWNLLVLISHLRGKMIPSANEVGKCVINYPF